MSFSRDRPSITVLISIFIRHSNPSSSTHNPIIPQKTINNSYHSLHFSSLSFNSSFDGFFVCIEWQKKWKEKFSLVRNGNGKTFHFIDNFPSISLEFLFSISWKVLSGLLMAKDDFIWILFWMILSWKSVCRIAAKDRHVKIKMIIS